MDTLTLTALVDAARNHDRESMLVASDALLERGDHELRYRMLVDYYGIRTRMNEYARGLVPGTISEGVRDWVAYLNSQVEERMRALKANVGGVSGDGEYPGEPRTWTVFYTNRFTAERVFGELADTLFILDQRGVPWHTVNEVTVAAFNHEPMAVALDPKGLERSFHLELTARLTMLQKKVAPQFIKPSNADISTRTMTQLWYPATFTNAAIPPTALTTRLYFNKRPRPKHLPPDFKPTRQYLERVRTLEEAP